MNINEIKEYLDANVENDEVKDFIKSLQNPITRDLVENWTKDGEGRSWRDSICDIYSDKAIKIAKVNAVEDFKKNELPKIIEDELKKKSNEGKTPEQIEAEEWRRKAEALEKEKAKAELSNKYTKILGEKGYTPDLVEFCFDEKEEGFNAKLEKISKLIDSSVEVQVKEKLGQSNYEPPTESNNVGKITWDSVLQNPELMKDYIAQSK